MRTDCATMGVLLRVGFESMEEDRRMERWREWIVCGLCGLLLLWGVPFVGCVVPLAESPPQETATDGLSEPTAEVDASDPEEYTSPEPQLIEKIPPPPPVSDGIKATIVHVTDGDTIYVRTGIGGRYERIRLKGINAPECHKAFNGTFQYCDKDDEAYGLEAYKFVKDYVEKHGDKVTITCVMSGDTCEQDGFDRYLATLRFEDGKDLAEETLRGGAGWTYTSFSFARTAEYCRAEADAIKAKRGMWLNGRAAVRTGMSTSTQSWYYNQTKSRSHDGICSQALGESFATLAGE